jgi:DnaA family protein
MKQLLLDIKPPSSPTLTSFLPGRNTELLHLLSNILAGREKERFVYLWGGLGCGKSHLLQAMVAGYTQYTAKAVYFSAKQNPDAKFFMDQDIDCVAVDDIHCLTESAQSELFNLYNQLRDETQAVPAREWPRCSGLSGYAPGFGDAFGMGTGVSSA